MISSMVNNVDTDRDERHSSGFLAENLFEIVLSEKLNIPEDS